MPVYCARWQEGSFSVVFADDEDEAYVKLDEFGGEPVEVWELGSCALDFELTDAGTFRLGQFGGQMRHEILEKAYPSLLEAIRSDLLEDHNVDGVADLAEYDPAARELLTKAVVAERGRFEGMKERPASTEIGKDIQRHVTGSGRYIDALVNEGTKRVLQEHTTDPGKKPN
jgi:hypothetical protein